jgi:Domain of unknown function (DUF4145)
MPVDREMFQRDYERMPHFPCPHCKHGRLNMRDGQRIVEPFGRTGAFDEPAFLKHKRFVMMAECTDCRGSVCVSGADEVRVDPVLSQFTKDPQPDYREIISAMHPAPPMIRLPENLEAPVAAEMRSAFECFWFDLDACAHKLRKSVEALLRAKNVTATTRDDTGNIRFLTLEEKLQKFPPAKRRPEWFGAIRLVGNFGSHGGIGLDVLFDALDIWEAALAEIYDDQVGRANELADKLTKMLKLRPQS